jgi:hypothetical protein
LEKRKSVWLYVYGRTNWSIFYILFHAVVI